MTKHSRGDQRGASVVQDLKEASSYLQANRLFIGLILVGFLYSLSTPSWNYGLPILSSAFAGPCPVESDFCSGFWWHR